MERRYGQKSGLSSRCDPRSENRDPRSPYRGPRSSTLAAILDPGPRSFNLDPRSLTAIAFTHAIGLNRRIYTSN